MAKLPNKKLLKDNSLVESDRWTQLEEGAEPTAYSVITLDYWRENKTALSSLVENGTLGLYLSADQTADQLGEECQSFGLISLDFPKFADGRAYSAARLLREKYGFGGELRAVGDVLIDQVFFMQRVGFTSYQLRDDQIVEDALAALSTFAAPYQPGHTDTEALFKRAQRG